MTGMGWMAIGLICGAFIILIFALCMAASESEDMERQWRMHPPDDDDGISLREDDDPDGQYTR